LGLDWGGKLLSVSAPGDLGEVINFKGREFGGKNCRSKGYKFIWENSL